MAKIKIKVFSETNNRLIGYEYLDTTRGKEQRWMIKYNGQAGIDGPQYGTVVPGKDEKIKRFIVTGGKEEEIK